MNANVVEKSVGERDLPATQSINSTQHNSQYTNRNNTHIELTQEYAVNQTAGVRKWQINALTNGLRGLSCTIS